MAYIEIFEINKNSTQDDVSNCIQWIQENYIESKFVTISIIIKRTQNQHIYVEETQDENQNQEDGQINQSSKKDKLSLKKVTLQHQEKKIEEKLQQKKSLQSDSIQKLQQIPKEIILNLHTKDEDDDQQKKDIEYFKDLTALTLQAEELFQEKQIDSAIEEYNKIQVVAQKYLEQQQDENIIAYKNNRQRETQNTRMDELDKERDEKYLYLLHIILNNYIKQGRSQLILKKSDQAIQYLEQGVEFYKQIKNKKLICKKYNQSVFVDIMLKPQILQELYSSLAETYQNTKNYEKSIQYFKYALKIIDRYQDQKVEGPKLRGNFFNFLGLTYYCIGNIEKAIQSFDESLQICLTLNGENDIQVANRMNNLGEAYRNDKQYEKALNLFFKSLDIKKKGDQSQKSMQGLGKTCLNIGITYQNMKEAEKAIEYYLPSVDYYKQYYNDHYKDEGGITLIVLYTSLAECYKEIKDFSEAAKYYEKVYEINKSMYGLKNKSTISIANSLATLLFKLQLFEKSVELFEQILSFQKQYHGEESIQVVQTLINMGTIFCKMKKYDLGLEKIDIALTILESNPSDQNTILIQNTKEFRQYYQNKLDPSKQLKKDLKLEEF